MRGVTAGLILLLAAVAALSSHPYAGSAASFTVNSTGDGPDVNTVDGVCDDGSGSCTLRAALMQANAAAGGDTVGFNLPGPAPHSIAPTSPLPTVSDTLTIDGTTQLGFAGTPIVEIRGDSAGANADGLQLSALNNMVRGLVINRFSANGVTIQGGGSSRVEGSFIGTDASGASDLGNTKDGILVKDSPNNIIGGSVSGTGNLISGNNQYGVEVTGNTATGNAVRGNLIGTDRSGSLSVGNTTEGIDISSSNNTVGGSSVSERNVVSGNGVGLVISASTGNIVRGNFIGTNAAGTGQVSNGTGVATYTASGNTLGGVGLGEGNLISSNTLYGLIFHSLSSGNIVQGNRIGTDVTGTKDLGNGSHGIVCGVAAASPGNIIGGTDPSAGNVISGNHGNGIDIGGAGCNNWRIQGNYIGTDITGTEPLGNSGYGVASVLDDTVIGGTAAGAGNTIAYNGLAGVGLGGVRNAVRANSIFANAGLGIDLGGNGVTPNDPGDPDSGANGLQNYPVLASAGSAGGNTTISGSLNSSSNATFDLDFFASSQCDPSFYGEGQRFLGSTTVVTNGSGDASFSVTFNGVNLDSDGDGVNEAVTATATDASGNTSEFSRCLGSGDNCPAWANPAQNLPPWFVPPNDPDCDGFSTRVENPVGTDPLMHCGTDAWPPDINNNGFVDIIGDISRVTADFGESVPPAPARYDMAPNPPDHYIDVISDITRMTGLFGQSCS